MKTVLSSLPNTTTTEAYLKISDVTYSNASRECHLTLRGVEKSYLAVFPDTVAFRVMDEREMGEFWTSSTEYTSYIQGAVVSRVDAGGWQGKDAQLSSGIKDGYFGNGSVAEYVVTSGYECLNIISAAPTFIEITNGT